MLTSPTWDGPVFRAMMYHDLPDGQDGFVLSILKMNAEAGLISADQFVARVEEMQKATEADCDRHAHNVHIQKTKKLVASGDIPPPTVSLSFGTSLQKGRATKGWSQKEMAQKMNMKVGDYAKWEKAEGTFPTPGQRVKLNRLLGIVLPSTFQ